MKKYTTYGIFTTSKYLGEVEAENEQQAKEIAEETYGCKLYVSLCCRCSEQVDDHLQFSEISVWEE